MLIPFITPASKPKTLHRRKGGGGGGGKSGGGGSSSSGKSGGSTSTGDKSGGSTTTGNTGGASSSPKTKIIPLTTSTASGKSSAVAYGSGGGKTIVIPSGQVFAGRPAGGGLRNQIYGTRTYGSGYPGVTGPGVLGRGFPFWFWPVVWVGYGAPVGSYLNAPEYGNPYNTSRVGGPMAEATFVSNSSNTTFHVLSDNSTISSLITSIDTNCSSFLSASSSTLPQPFNASAPGAPQPEQALQYYRASSIVLTLDGYNNSATLSDNLNATDSPLPSSIDSVLLYCLNQTIALSAPLVNGASSQWSAGPSGTSLLGFLCLAWWAFYML